MDARIGQVYDRGAGAIAVERAYAAPNYAPLPVVLERGAGCWLWDTDGKRYLDMMSAYSAVSHGHAHPRLVRALIEQAQQVAVTSRAYHSAALVQNQLLVFGGEDGGGLVAPELHALDLLSLRWAVPATSGPGSRSRPPPATRPAIRAILRRPAHDGRRAFPAGVRLCPGRRLDRRHQLHRRRRRPQGPPGRAQHGRPDLPQVRHHALRARRRGRHRRRHGRRPATARRQGPQRRPLSRGKPWALR